MEVGFTGKRLGWGTEGRFLVRGKRGGGFLGRGKRGWEVDLGFLGMGVGRTEWSRWWGGWGNDILDR